ncbi:uncharacterized protein LOC126969019 isoform X2 [Leptidea sinapis]|uniref:uncharacterized protein LOC126969019 isoform X2 n=1 Tax=Leptidea sinapis TaxID=189913 RepID=UPI0021C26E3C|nr:uncharacterized protein LOC126969019 isoform X2 [Leptidea sinapis]
MYFVNNLPKSTKLQKYTLENINLISMRPLKNLLNSCFINQCLLNIVIVMNNSAAKVGEIFTEAGAAFNKLAEMTMLLHPLAEQTTSSQTKTPVKRKPAEECLNVSSSSSGQVTLNMLNATEIDAEGLGNVKLEFESSTEEVPT